MRRLIKSSGPRNSLARARAHTRTRSHFALTHAGLKPRVHALIRTYTMRGSSILGLSTASRRTVSQRSSSASYQCVALPCLLLSLSLSFSFFPCLSSSVFSDRFSCVFSFSFSPFISLSAGSRSVYLSSSPRRRYGRGSPSRTVHSFIGSADAITRDAHRISRKAHGSEQFALDRAPSAAAASGDDARGTIADLYSI